jgi:hypothetical protein
MVRKMSSNFTEAEIQNLQDKVEILWPSPLMGYKLQVVNNSKQQ